MWRRVNFDCPENTCSYEISSLRTMIKTRGWESIRNTTDLVQLGTKRQCSGSQGSDRYSFDIQNMSDSLLKELRHLHVRLSQNQHDIDRTSTDRISHPQEELALAAGEGEEEEADLTINENILDRVTTNFCAMSFIADWIRKGLYWVTSRCERNWTESI